MTGRQDPMRCRANSPQFRVDERQARTQEGTRTARLSEQRAKENGSSVAAARTTSSTYESQGKKKETKGPRRRGEVRPSWRMSSGRRGQRRWRRRRPVAGSRGAPHRRCSGAGAGGGEKRDVGWVGGAGCARAWVLELLYRSGRMGEGRERGSAS